jgi:hypothetical protein
LEVIVMAERNNRNVRHLAYRDAELVRTEVLRKKTGLAGAEGQHKVKRHGWPLPEEHGKHPSGEAGQ